MMEVKAPLVLLILILWTFTSADVELVCVLTQRCVLPCTFTPGGEEVVHWVQLKEGIIQVHSYYRDQDQLSGQNQRFRNRTSLFRDKISGGNASLQLTGLQLQDQGRYKCFTSTISGGNEESFINLNAEASVQVSLTEATITCAASNTKPPTGLVWRFNHSQIILTRTGADVNHAVSDEWRQRVKASESGSLTLQELSSHQTGIYTCELSDAEETFITNIFLKMEIHQDTSGNVALIVGLVLIIAALVVIAAIVYKRREKKKGII